MQYVASLPMQRHRVIVSFESLEDIFAESSQLGDAPMKWVNSQCARHVGATLTRSVIINHARVRLGSQLAAFPSSLPISRINYISCIHGKQPPSTPPPPPPILLTVRTNFSIIRVIIMFTPSEFWTCGCRWRWRRTMPPRCAATPATPPS